VVEGPLVRIRKIDFKGNKSFSGWRLKEEIKSGYYIWIFRPGTFDPEQVVRTWRALRQFYEKNGFFDVRIGRKLIFSPDMTEMQINFEIEEGVRYKIESVAFKATRQCPSPICARTSSWSKASL